MAKCAFLMSISLGLLVAASMVVDVHAADRLPGYGAVRPECVGLGDENYDYALHVLWRAVREELKRHDETGEAIGEAIRGLPGEDACPEEISEWMRNPDNQAILRNVTYILHSREIKSMNW